jgi:hypothetical protein
VSRGGARANVNGGWVGRRQGRAVARVHFAHFAPVSFAKWTLGSHGVHFVHFAEFGMARWTKCTLAAARRLPRRPVPQAVSGGAGGALAALLTEGAALQVESRLRVLGLAEEDAAALAAAAASPSSAPDAAVEAADRQRAAGE